MITAVQLSEDNQHLNVYANNRKLDIQNTLIEIESKHIKLFFSHKQKTHFFTEYLFYLETKINSPLAQVKIVKLIKNAALELIDSSFSFTTVELILNNQTKSVQ